MIKIYQIDENNWVAAESIADAQAHCREYLGFGDGPGDLDDTRALTDQEMDEFLFTGFGDDMLEEPITFRQQLTKMIAENEEFPCVFAISDDY